MKKIRLSVGKLVNAVRRMRDPLGKIGLPAARMKAAGGGEPRHIDVVSDEPAVPHRTAVREEAFLHSDFSSIEESARLRRLPCISEEELAGVDIDALLAAI